MPYLYHYCAMTQMQLGAVEYASGTLTTTARIATPPDYEKAWERIADYSKWPKGKTTITSLTFLGESSGNGQP